MEPNPDTPDPPSEEELAGWPNLPTRDFWAWLTSFLVNKLLYLKMREAGAADDHLRMRFMAAKALDGNPRLGTARTIIEEFEAIDWGSIAGELRTRGDEKLWYERD